MLNTPTEVDLNWRDPLKGMAQVHLWAKDGNLNALKRWQTAGGALDMPWAYDTNSAPEGDGSTALLFAVMNTRTEAMRWLLAEGADVRACNGKGRNSLHLIAYRFSSGDQSEQDLDALIDAGVPLEDRENDDGNAGCTPLLAELTREWSNTSKTYRMEHLRSLVVAGADMDTTDKDGNLALHHYLGDSDMDMLRDFSHSAKRSRERQVQLASLRPKSERKRPRA